MLQAEAFRLTRSFGVPEKEASPVTEMALPPRLENVEELPPLTRKLFAAIVSE